MNGTHRIEPVPPSKQELDEAFSSIRESGRREQTRQDVIRRRILATTALLAIGISLLASVGAALLVAQERAARLAAELDYDRQREVVARSTTQLDDINRRLRAQGKPPIAQPAPGEDSTDAIAKVVLGQVLTQLPAGPDARQVGQAIAGRVTDNLLGTTRSQVAEAAATYLQANPAPAGRPPTLAEIQAAVDQAYAANPPPAGPPGKPGDPGVSPACLSEPGQCRGADGTDGAPGPPGRSVTGQRFVRAGDGTCVSEVTFSDGAVQTDPAGDAACPGAAPLEPDPTTTEATPTD